LVGRPQRFVGVVAAVAVARNDYRGIGNPNVLVGAPAVGADRGVREDFADAPDGRAHFLRAAVAEAALCDE